MEVYPIFSFKREYHLRLLQHEIMNDRLYPIYLYIKEIVPKFFNRFNTKIFIRNYNEVNARLRELNADFQATKLADRDGGGYTLDLDKKLKMRLFEINAIFNPFIVNSTEELSTFIDTSTCPKLLSILAMEDDSLNKSYEFYIKIINEFNETFNIAEVYRQCLIRSKEDQDIIQKYGANEQLMLFENSMKDIRASLFVYQHNLKVVQNSYSDHREKLIKSGFRVSSPIQFPYIGDYGNIEQFIMFYVNVPESFSREYFRFKAIDNPYIRACYHNSIV
ncbi:hypothetical protein D3C87_1445530 [compost metagenome]